MVGVGTFLLVVVALAVVAGVAVAVSGRGAMVEAVPDTPAVGLPDGPVDPADLDAVRFPLALRGYRMGEVDAVLDRVRDEWAASRAEVTALRAEVTALRADVTALRDAAADR